MCSMRNILDGWWMDVTVTSAVSAVLPETRAATIWQCPGQSHPTKSCPAENGNTSPGAKL